MNYIPPTLKPHEGSWAIIRKSDGELMCELFKNSVLIGSLNADKYKAIPITEHLAFVQDRIDQGDGTNGK